MHKAHRELLKKLRAKKRLPDKKFDHKSYLGTPRNSLRVKTADVRQIAKDYKKEHKDMPTAEFFIIVESFIIEGKTFTEKCFGGILMQYFSTQRESIPLSKIDKWLGHLEGWAEIDTLCQSTFTGKEVLARWDEWEKLLVKLNKSKNISKRRASLVLLVKSAREEKDKKISKLAFNNIENVKSESDKLITKAVSWLLREMIKNYKSEVKAYLSKNRDTLPVIAVRETTKKLETGRK